MDPGFALLEQARRKTPPKRVRHPAGCSFASGCSPPRIAATQLPSATWKVTSHGLDLHQTDNATSRTHSRLAALQRPPLRGLRPLQQSSTTAGLMGSGRLILSVTYPSSCQRFRQVLLRSPWRVRCSHQLISGSSDPACQGAACMDDRAGGMGLIFGTADRQVPICDSVLQPHILPARHTRLGCRNSAHCRRYRVRVAP